MVFSRFVRPAAVRWLGSLIGGVALVGGALALLPTASQAASDCAISASDAAIDGEEQALLDGINAYRQQNSLVPLVFSPTAGRAATWMSRDMATTFSFSHTDSLGRDPWTRMAACGYTFATSKGENLAAGYADAASTLNQWKTSPGHNAILLGASYRAVGIGRVANLSAPYRYYWTLNVGGYVESSSGAATATATATATTIVNPTTPPNAPSNLRLGTSNATSFQVRWNDNSANETRIQVAHQAASASSWTYVDLGANATSYTIMGTQPGNTYYVFVRACNAVGCSAWGSGIAVTISSQ